MIKLPESHLPNKLVAYACGAGEPSMIINNLHHYKGIYGIAKLRGFKIAKRKVKNRLSLYQITREIA